MQGWMLIIDKMDCVDKKRMCVDNYKGNRERKNGLER